MRFSRVYVCVYRNILFHLKVPLSPLYSISPYLPSVLEPVNHRPASPYCCMVALVHYMCTCAFVLAARCTCVREPLIALRVRACTSSCASCWSVSFPYVSCARGLVECCASCVSLLVLCFASCVRSHPVVIRSSRLVPVYSLSRTKRIRALRRQRLWFCSRPMPTLRETVR